jgi:hypothetical protein
MTDSIRLSKYRALYVGSVNNKSSAKLKVKAMNDHTTMKLLRSRREIYHPTNIQSTTPKSSHMPVLRHRAPLFNIPENRGFNQYVKGNSLYNQHVLRNIRELSKLI